VYLLFCLQNKEPKDSTEQMAQYFFRKGTQSSFIKLMNPPVNGFSLAVREGVMKCLDQAKRDKSRGIVIFGEGKNFSAGADISEFSKGKHLIRPGLTEVKFFIFRLL
jgi:enoyl-CoA hydratase/carnithine racemase